MDQELRQYLGLLLEHECARGQEGCPECRSLARIYEFMLSELFSTVVYPETALELRQAKDSAEGVKRALSHRQRHPS